MVAIDAVSEGGLRGGVGDAGVVFFVGGGGEEVQDGVEILQVSDARTDAEDAGAVEGVLQALGVGESDAQGGGFAIEESAAVEGFHDGDADAHGFAFLVEGHAGEGVAAGVDGVGVLAGFFEIVGGVDAEEHEIDETGIEDF